MYRWKWSTVCVVLRPFDVGLAPHVRSLIVLRSMFVLKASFRVEYRVEIQAKKKQKKM